jgi:hypothetical protein
LAEPDRYTQPFGDAGDIVIDRGVAVIVAVFESGLENFAADGFFRNLKSRFQKTQPVSKS